MAAPQMSGSLHHDDSWSLNRQQLMWVQKVPCSIYKLLYIRPSGSLHSHSEI